jgi:hypothetical protein
VAAVAVIGLAVYGVALLPRDDHGLPREVTVVRSRDLGALVRQAPYVRAACTPGELEAYRQIIDAATRTGAVLPAPCGTVFRSAEQVRRWLEQNYLALSEGVHFASAHCEARVHLLPRTTGLPDERAPDVVAAAAECFRLLRRAAEAAIPVRHDPTTEVLRGAFLARRARWDELVEQIHEQANRFDPLVLEYTGPWPPYDFIRMDFGN